MQILPQKMRSLAALFGPLILSGGGEIVHQPGVELRGLGSTPLSGLFNAASLMVEQAEQDPSPRQI